MKSATSKLKDDSMGYNNALQKGSAKRIPRAEFKNHLFTVWNSLFLTDPPNLALLKNI